MPSRVEPNNFIFRRVYGILIRDHLIFFGAILIFTIINIIVRPYMVSRSLEYQMNLQENGRSSYWMAFYDKISWFGSTDFIYFVLVMVYIFGSRALAFQYTLVISFAMFFLVFMKLVIRFPRPY